ncbi:hypothetical protein BKA56DRAFT_275230 [Ilyonectria sp. MPI-CAGE-AT-0026]|nr:hypothetical protein BKA56DRAFT_275230 [Ilyonectria sp. MPI-CAGE-AT-0026]
MSLTLPVPDHTLPREHVPESAARCLQQSPLPLIDSLPTSPSLYSDDADDEIPRKPNQLSHNMMPRQRQPTAEQAPALPERSARRASRMLDGLTPHKLIAEDQQPPLKAQSAPHDVYLSSEEDASSSADDFSDFECESSSEQSQKSAIRRGSQEDTARVVSVIFSGKPSIVDLPRRSISPSSSETSSRPPSRLRRTSTMPIMDHRRVSMSSSPSGSSVRSSIMHPPRTSSMLPSSRLEKQRPHFLNIDPFATKTEREEEHNNGDLKTPKTPTGMFKRTLSLVKKRSRPSLNTHFNTQHSSLSRDSLPSFIMPSSHMEQVREESPAPEPKSAPRPVSRGPVTYHDIVMSAKRRAQTTPMSPISPLSEPASPMTPNGTRQRLRQGFSSARRRSIKA